MSYIAQGFATGLCVGTAVFFFSQSHIRAQYAITSRELSRFNLAINPKHVVDEYKVQKVPVRRDWNVADAPDTQHSIGRRPGEIKNMYLVRMYAAFATRAFNPKPQPE